MASLSATSISLGASTRLCCPTTNLHQVTGTSKVTVRGWSSNSSFISLKTSHHRRRRLCITCAAKPETVEKVCEIVRKQLALPAETALSGESKFSALGADSLDTVEIVMGLEEEFDISVEEESSQNITTVQEAADLIEKLVEKKTAPA